MFCLLIMSLNWYSFFLIMNSVCNSCIDCEFNLLPLRWIWIQQSTLSSNLLLAQLLFLLTDALFVALICFDLKNLCWFSIYAKMYVGKKEFTSFQQITLYNFLIISFIFYLIGVRYVINWKFYYLIYEFNEKSCLTSSYFGP